jgi:DNA-binding NarL/FixJ family response regulator
MASGGVPGPHTRIVVADDNVLLREGIASLLKDSGYDVVGQAGDGEQLVKLVREMVPDLAIIDIRMPPTNTWEGIEAARQIRSESPDVGILLLSAHVEVETAIDLIESDDSIGYLLKDRVMKVADLVDALQRIAEGESVIDPALVRELFSKKTKDDPLAQLTDREVSVLALVAEGRSNRAIAQRLFVSEGAVEKHVRSILTKLKLPTNDEDHRRVLAVLTFLGASQ